MKERSNGIPWHQSRGARLPRHEGDGRVLSNVLEMPLVKTLDLPDGRGQHFFFDCGGGSTIAFFWFPDAPAAAPGVASMDRRPGASMVTAHASMNHLAISIPLEKFDAYARAPQGEGRALHVLNHNDGPEHASTRRQRHDLDPLDVLRRSERHLDGARRFHPALHRRRRRPRARTLRRPGEIPTRASRDGARRGDCKIVARRHQPPPDVQSV